VVDAHALVARELELPIDFLAWEGLRFLMRHTDEHDAIAHTALLPDPVGDVVFPPLWLNW
jgi:hypothetical protein